MFYVGIVNKKKDRKMIDLNNTWCEATEETEKYLYKNVSKNTHNLNKENIFIIEKVHNKLDVKTINYIPNSNYKQIHLVNGEFQYVEPKTKNNFKDYGFEADFEGEILAVKDDKYFGISKSTESEGWVANGWKIDGTCLYDYVSHIKPIKKQWYENPDNFPCIVYSLKLNEYIVLDRPLVPLKLNDEFRPATKEEILTLLIKEE